MGKKLSQIRHQRGMGRRELSEMTGISLSLIDALEEGILPAVSVHDAVALADALNVAVNELFNL